MYIKKISRVVLYLFVLDRSALSLNQKRSEGLKAHSNARKFFLLLSLTKGPVDVKKRNHLHAVRY